jgi:hypothetical protein
MTEEITTETPKKPSFEEVFTSKFDALRQEAKESLTIDQSKIEGEMIRYISNLHMFNSRLAEERLVLSKIDRKKAEVHAELFHKIRYSNNVKVSSQWEIDEWIEKEDKWKKICNMFSHRKILIDFLEQTVKNLNTATYILRAIVENKKIEMR